MGYQKNTISEIVRSAAPKDKKPTLTNEQIEAVKTAGGIALVILMAAGMIALSAVTPNIFAAYGKLFSRKGKRYSQKEVKNKVVRSFYYLKHKGLIGMRPTVGDFKIYVTALARKKIKSMQFRTMRVEKPKKWDKKWWQVAADIPTKEHKTAADALRRKLKEMNFYPLQRTLWFYPHDPRLEIDWIVRVYHIERFVTIMEINRLDRDDEEKMVKFFRKQKII